MLLGVIHNTPWFGSASAINSNSKTIGSPFVSSLFSSGGLELVLLVSSSPVSADFCSGDLVSSGFLFSLFASFSPSPPSPPPAPCASGVLFSEVSSPGFVSLLPSSLGICSTYSVNPGVFGLLFLKFLKDLLLLRFFQYLYE